MAETDYFSLLTGQKGNLIFLKIGENEKGVRPVDTV